MANQYTGNFEVMIRQKFNCSARDILIECARKGLTYAEAQDWLGFKHGTIRKWSKRFGLKLRPGESARLKAENYLLHARKKSINKYNALHKPWLCQSIRMICT